MGGSGLVSEEGNPKIGGLCPFGFPLKLAKKGFPTKAYSEVVFYPSYLLSNKSLPGIAPAPQSVGAAGRGSTAGLVALCSSRPQVTNRSYCGWTKSCTTLKPLLAGTYLQGSHIKSLDDMSF